MENNGKKLHFPVNPGLGWGSWRSNTIALSGETTSEDWVTSSVIGNDNEA